MHLYEVIRRPVVTEKTDRLSEQLNCYVFEVHPDANKRQIREAVETIFEVKVAGVRTMMLRGKTRRWGRRISRTPAWKKAIVTLPAGQRIDLSE
jgi:large subunit ribosomal protein L23